MKKIKPYLYTGLITLGILLVVSAVKGIFPFGDNSFIWGDMHDQITAFYYHLYDTVYGNNSIFVTFSSGAAINFLGILAYYILSPFSLLVLLVPRDYIYLMVSVIIVLKMITCSITCLYFLRTYFKNMPSLLSMLLAIIYAFSGYALMMYQITPWIDAMYMFPLIMLGLKKLLDLEKPTFYIITLTLSLIFSFYVSMMVIIFIFFASFIYLLNYKTKDETKKAITSLGISTVLALLMAAFVIIPAYLQISTSSRVGFYLQGIINSKTGPIRDKFSMLAFGGVMYAGLIMLLLKFKEHKKFLTFYLPTLLLVLIPIVIEPINRVWHFGSYVCFPCRNGFILMFMLILGAAYGYDHYKEGKTLTVEINKYASLFVASAAGILIIRYSHRYYDRLQAAIYKLSISADSRMVFVLLLTTAIATIGCLIILGLNKKLSTFVITLLFAISVTHITANSLIYLGNDKNQEILTKEYRMLNNISKDYPEGEYYRVKNNLIDMIMNSGIVMKYHNVDHFTSLTNKDAIQVLKKLGYSSTWVKTHSNGGTLFLDAILANKYILSDEDHVNPYYEPIKNYNGAEFYKLKHNVPYGVIISNDDTVLDKNNSFEIANSLYHNILDTKEDIFEIDNKFSLDNIKGNLLDAKLVEYSIVDGDYYAYFEKDVIVTGKKNLYLEVAHQIGNDQNYRINKAFNLYVNDKLVKENAFNEPHNGVMDLGIYENEKVNIKLELKKSVLLKEITVGLMDLDKYEDFINKTYSDHDIKYNRNKLSLKVTGTKDKILLLPIIYDKGFTASVNGKNVEISKVYDAFVGIPLEEGENNINIKYVSIGIKPSLIVSVVFLIVTILLIKFNVFSKIWEIKIINNMAYYVYLGLYFIMILGVYVLLTLCFIVSYFIYLRV